MLLRGLQFKSLFFFFFFVGYIESLSHFRIDLQEEIITDNEVHSDLDPLEAPVWSTSVQFDDLPHCLLSKKLLGSHYEFHSNKHVSFG